MTTVPAPPRLAYVTAVGWIFIVLGAFATAMALLQNIMVHFSPAIRAEFSAP